MQIKWLESETPYDGSQLSPLYNYLEHGILGDSIIGWMGPCSVTLDHMLDGEDLRENATIAGSKMLHFVLEIFDFPMPAAAAFQRLMGELLITQLRSASSKAAELERRGDDVYLGDRKLNISIATGTVNSSLVHFAFNVSNEGTPVKTCALEDFGVPDVGAFGRAFMDSCKSELVAIKRATRKVRRF